MQQQRRGKGGVFQGEAVRLLVGGSMHDWGSCSGTAQPCRRPVPELSCKSHADRRATPESQHTVLNLTELAVPKEKAKKEDWGTPNSALLCRLEIWGLVLGVSDSFK